MGVTGSGRLARPASSMLIAQLARGTRRRIEEATTPTGLRPRELVVLQHLSERGPSAQQTLCGLLGVDATNLVAVLNSLEDSGLIERSRDRADRRRAIIALSRRGEEALAVLQDALCRIDDEMLAPLTQAERETLNGLLAKAVTHIGGSCSRAPDDAC